MGRPLTAFWRPTRRGRRRGSTRRGVQSNWCPGAEQIERHAGRLATRYRHWKHTGLRRAERHLPLPMARTATAPASARHRRALTATPVAAARGPTAPRVETGTTNACAACGPSGGPVMRVMSVASLSVGSDAAAGHRAIHRLGRLPRRTWPLLQWRSRGCRERESLTFSHPPATGPVNAVLCAPSEERPHTACHVRG